MSHSEDSSIESNSAASGASSRGKLGALEQASLRTTAVHDWSIQQVAAFLQSLGIEDSVVQRAVSEMVTGVELLELQNDDLRELGISKMGPRKKVLTRIQKLKERGIDALDESSTTQQPDASDDQSSSAGSAVSVAVTAFLKKNKTTLNVSSHVTLENLLLQLSQAFGCRVKVKLEDEDGDQIAITNDQQLHDALAGEDAVTFQCLKDLKWVGRSAASPAAKKSGAATAKSSAGSDAVAEFADKYAMFDELLDAYIVIDAEGTVLAFNPPTEKLLGYAKKKVLGKNVKMLMPDTYAKKHDTYLARYARTGVKTIVDSKRTVMAKDSSGGMIAVELGVTEKEIGDTSHFVGCMRVAGTDDGSQSSSHASMNGGSEVQLDKQMRKNMTALQEAAIIITAEGRIVLFNKAAEAMFGRTASEVVGGPVEMLMPSPHKENHSYYLQRFIATGEARVMNSSRNVQALHKNGQLIDINLALSEAETPGGDQIFIGLISANKQLTHKTTGKASVVKAGSLLQLTRQMLNSMTIPGVIINEGGIIQAFNRDAEKLLGYTLIDVVGRNVSILMNPTDAEKHDSYLQRFLKTKEAHVIGQERVVVAKTKTGKLINVQLSVTEATDEAGKSLFTGMLHKTKSDMAEAKTRKKSKKTSSKTKEED